MIEKVAAQGLRVSDRLSDDKQILSMLPRCFSDNECKKEGLVGVCQNPGNRKANCIFSEALKVNLTVITSKECLTCSTDAVVNSLKKELSGLKATYFYYPDKRANNLMADLKLNGLPVYLLDKEVIKDKGFDNLKSNFEEKGDYFMLRPEASGISYFIDRKKIPGRLDIFLSLFDKNSYGLLNVIKEFRPQLHFLAIVREEKTDAPFGLQEVEEDLRSVCVNKYYPEKFWDYISCRAKDINSTWWEDCAAGMDIQKIKNCARSDEGKGLLKNNSQLNNELKISRGPTYLLDNRQIFSSKGVPSKEELEKIIRGEK